jgi:hypothetical protein
MTVMRKHRNIKERWAFGKCEKCGYNPKDVKMAKERLVSGDPGQKHSSKKKVWVCTRCGYSRRL